MSVTLSDIEKFEFKQKSHGISRSLTLENHIILTFNLVKEIIWLSLVRFEKMWSTWTELSQNWDGATKDIINTILSAAVVVPIVFVLAIVVWLLRINNEKVITKIVFCQFATFCAG